MNIKNLILADNDVSYKLLSIGKIVIQGRPLVQVHCDRLDLQFSKLYKLHYIDDAINAYLDIYRKYKTSEQKYGNFVPLDKINVPKI